MDFPRRPLVMLLGALLGTACVTETANLYDFDEDGSLDGDDCNVADPTVYPGAPEILNDGIDQDCDGADGDADDLDADGILNQDDCAPLDPSIYPGADDGYGDDIDQDCDGGDGIDNDGDGYPANEDQVGQAWYDCNDNDAAVHPGATEVPGDGIDNNCDGGTVVDNDGDGYGPDSGDCDDENASIHPAAPEVCNDGVDDDCNGLTHELLDSDGDGLSACEGDCDDARSFVAPDVLEICDDGLDNDCDGTADADCLTCDISVLSDQQSIQSAFANLSADATLCIYPGAYTENLEMNVNFSAALVGVAPAVRTVLQGDGSAAVLAVSDLPPDDGSGAGGADATGTQVSISRLWLRGGVAEIGAGLQLQTNADVVLSHLIVSDNHANSFGGGISSEQGSLTASDLVVERNSSGEQGGGLHIGCVPATLTRVKIRDNEADDSGGGIALRPCPNESFVMSEFELRDNEAGSFFASLTFRAGTGGGLYSESRPLDLSLGLFHSNSARDLGGALYFSASDPATVASNLMAVQFWFNSADYRGGAVYFDGGNPPPPQAHLTGQNLAFVRNGATDSGGAMFARNPRLSLSNSAFVVNHSANAAGALCLKSDSNLAGASAADIANTVFVSNYAGDTGGAVVIDTGHADAVQIRHTSFAGNYTPGTGGAISLGADASPAISNSLFLADLAYDGSLNPTTGLADAIYGSGSPAAPPSISYCNFWEANFADFGVDNNFFGLTGIIGSNGNTQVDPQILDASSSNAYDWDLHLAVDSPLRDAGDPAGAADPDGSVADIGVTGGPDGDMDLDADGYPAWWQPGPYEPGTYPALGWDCDDSSADIHPGATEVAGDGIDSDCDGSD